MDGRSEEELEEVLASFKRVWRSGGRASLSLHANQGELEARVSRQICRVALSLLLASFTHPFCGFVAWYLGILPPNVLLDMLGNN